MKSVNTTASRTALSALTASALLASSLGVPFALPMLAALTPSVASAQTAAVYTDLWWNAAESGWGMNLNHQNDIIFATWFTYGANNSAQWFVMSDLRRQADGSFTGIVYQTTGVPFNQISGAQATRSVNNVGTATLRFSSNNNGTFAYTVNGVTQTKNITRQPLIATATSCTQQASTASRTASQNYQDLWYIPAESGWGINLTHQGDILFATWFTYRADGSGQWLVASNVARQSDGSYTGRLFRTTGTNFSQINGAPSSSSVTDVGSITFRFSNGENGVMTYSLDGVSGTKNIVRQVFGSTVNVCTNPASTVTTTTPPPGPPVSGQCVNTYDFTTGNTYVYRSTSGTSAPTEALHTIRGPGTFQGRAVIVVEIRNLVNGQPDTAGYSNLYYEDRGSTIGVIGAQSFIGTSTTPQATTTYSPVDYAPKTFSVGATIGGTFTASTNANQSGLTTTAQTVYTYSGTVASNENVTVPAGSFATCRTVLDRISTRTSFSIAGLPSIPGVPSSNFDYTCNATGTGNSGSIGGVRSTSNATSCTGAFPQGVTATSLQINNVSELVRASVSGRSYP
jgi:hypothetical protein